MPFTGPIYVSLGWVCGRAAGTDFFIRIEKWAIVFFSVCMVRRSRRRRNGPPPSFWRSSAETPRGFSVQAPAIITALLPDFSRRVLPAKLVAACRVIHSVLVPYYGGFANGWAFWYLPGRGTGRRGYIAQAHLHAKMNATVLPRPFLWFTLATLTRIRPLPWILTAQKKKKVFAVVLYPNLAQPERGSLCWWPCTRLPHAPPGDSY